VGVRGGDGVVDESSGSLGIISADMRTSLRTISTAPCVGIVGRAIETLPTAASWSSMLDVRFNRLRNLCRKLYQLSMTPKGFCLYVPSP
jgi:hypothetical protein